MATTSSLAALGQLEAARLLTYKAAWAKDQGGRYSEESAMAKLYASEAAVTATRIATQIHGGGGRDEFAGANGYG